MRTSWTNDGHVQLLSRIQTETDMDIPLRGVRVCPKSVFSFEF